MFSIFCFIDGICGFVDGFCGFVDGRLGFVFLVFVVEDHPS